MRLWPRSLAGQMAVLIALALFIAQAVNFALALRDRAEFRLAQATRPVAVRIADAIEREAQGRPIARDRGRIRRADGNGIPASLDRVPEVGAELRQQLHDQGVEVGRIDTGLRPWTATDDAVLGRAFTRDRRRHDLDRPSGALLIAIEQPGRGWLAVVVPWGDGGNMRLFWRLFAQTLILYGVVLLPVLWIARRISRPLRDLTLAAQQFGRGHAAAAGPVPVRGPQDIAGLVESFNALRLRVTAMLEEKDRMLGAIGHDLRTPLAALRVRIESVDDENDRAKMADTVDEMNRTLDDILSLARLGRPSEPATETDLAALVDAVVEDFRDLGADVGFVESDRLPLRLRPSLMRRALRNLLENAIKYGRSATVRLEPAVRTVAIVVEDRGPGIPEDRLADVFEPFTRLETSRNRDTGGSGLGLALARAIVREAGGDVVLANRADGGLAATITLPR